VIGAYFCMEIKGSVHFMECQEPGEVLTQWVPKLYLLLHLIEIDLHIKKNQSIQGLINSNES